VTLNKKSGSSIPYPYSIAYLSVVPIDWRDGKPVLAPQKLLVP
jgi:hypothetical protein